MINVWKNGIPAGQFPGFIWRHGPRFFLRLTDVTLSQNSRGQWNAEPLYDQLMIWSRNNGSVTIDLFLPKLHIVSVIGNHPYLQVTRQ